MSTYGNRQLSLIFFPVVETHANGFIFKEEVLWVGGSRADRGVGKGVAAFQHGARLSCAARALHSQGWEGHPSQRAGIRKKSEPLGAGYLSAFDKLVDLFNKNKRLARPKLTTNR